MIVPIFCCGQHTQPVKLAELDLPAGDDTVDVDGHRFGALCETCAVGYTYGVEQGTLPTGMPPTAEQVQVAIAAEQA